MTTIIDHSETVSNIAVGLLSNTVVERDAGTPSGDPVVVQINNLSLGIGSSLLVENGAKVVINGVAGAGVLGKLLVGHNGVLELNDPLSINVGSSVGFYGVGGTLVIDPSVEHSLLSASQPGLLNNRIGGFTGTDVIQLNGVAGATHAVWQQGIIGGGTLHLLNASGQEVGRVGLNGTYTSSQFHLHANSAGTAIAFS